MRNTVPLHQEFVERLKRAWAARDPDILEGLLADDIETILQHENRRLTSKKATIHWLGNLWVVQQDSWTDWRIISDSESNCRIVGRAGYTNAAYSKGVTFTGTMSVEFNGGLVVRVDVDLRANLDQAAEAS